MMATTTTATSKTDAKDDINKIDKSTPTTDQQSINPNVDDDAYKINGLTISKNSDPKPDVPVDLLNKNIASPVLNSDFVMLDNGTLDSDDDNTDNNDNNDDNDDDNVPLPTLNNNIDDDDDDDDSSDDEKDPYMDEWQCSSCTLIQHISNRLCELCGTTAPPLSRWQENMITEWDNMGDCVFYDTIKEIIVQTPDGINSDNPDDFNVFMVKLESLGIKSDHSKSRAVIMLEMIKAQERNNGIQSPIVYKHKYNYNPSQVMVKNALNKAISLKTWMKNNDIWAKDLFLVLVQHGITEVPHHLYLIDSWYRFHEIIREVRVERRKTLKSDKARKNLDKLCTKFEKLWKKEVGFQTSLTANKKTYKHLPKNVFVNSTTRKKNSDQLKKIAKDFRRKKKQKTKNKKKLEKKSKPLKNWMKKNNIWQLTLYQQLLNNKLLENYLIDPLLMLKNINENIFDDIVRKVRVERFSQLKDQASRQRCDKILLNFEKIWRKTSGIKKTSIK